MPQQLTVRIELPGARNKENMLMPVVPLAQPCPNPSGNHKLSDPLSTPPPLLRPYRALPTGEMGQYVIYSG